mgnify:CR=1 FL=1
MRFIGKSGALTLYGDANTAPEYFDPEVMGSFALAHDCEGLGCLVMTRPLSPEKPPVTAAAPYVAYLSQTPVYAPITGALGTWFIPQVGLVGVMQLHAMLKSPR